MKRVYPAAILACVGVWAFVSAVWGGQIPLPPPGPARVATADAVIVGKVEAIEPQDVKVGNSTHRIAVVRINDAVRGVKDEKTLRIGFVPLPMPQVGKGPIVISSGARPVQLAAGQEGLFILKKQAKETFYTIGGVVGYYINSDKNPGFDKEVQAAKTAAKLMDNPQAGLKSKDADERLLAAAILIDRYRTFRGPTNKQEPIDAEESNEIMKVLADADWQGQLNFMGLRAHPQQLFQQLSVTAKDGFMPTGTNYQAAAQKWVRDNASKYRIQRYVAGAAK